MSLQRYFFEDAKKKKAIELVKCGFDASIQECCIKLFDNGGFDASIQEIGQECSIVQIMDLNYLSIDTARGNCEREEIFYPFIKYLSTSKVIEMAALAVTDGKFKSFF